MLPVRFSTGAFGSPLFSWDPFRVLDRATRCFDAACDGEPESAVSGFEVDVREDENGYAIEANLPGVDKETMEVTFEDGVLTISAEGRSDQERNDGDFHIRERQVGKFSRSFRLPGEVDPEKVNAKLADGVLTVTVAKVEAQKPHKITVQAG